MINDIKKYEGSISDDVYLSALRTSSMISLGEIFEAAVSCYNCTLKDICTTKIKPAFDEARLDVDCAEVVDILLGNKTIDEVVAYK